MQYEMIDIVDENDNVVRTISRTPAWDKTRPDIYRVVHVLVWTPEGKLVIQQRSHKKNAAPLRFDMSVGGLVPAGMGYEDAAKKEMLEELGLSTPLRFIASYREVNIQNGKITSHNHLFETTSEGVYRDWEEEAERLEFMTIEEAVTLSDRFPYLFTQGFIQSLACYRQFKAAA